MRRNRDDQRDGRPTIGVLCGWQAYHGRLDAYLQSVLEGLIAAAEDADANLLIACGVATSDTLATAAWPAMRPNQLFTPVGPWNTDGIVVINPLWNDDAPADVRRWQAEGHPLAFIGRGEDGPTVIVDNAGGIAQAVEHLAAHGHERIAFLSALHGDGPERQRGYEETVHRLGLAADPALIADGNHEATGGRRAIDELLANGVEFTALVASNESCGRGALVRLQEHGVAVPDEVALVGFDDLLEALSTEPAMSCVHVPVDEVARHAVDVLLTGIGSDEAPPLTVVPTSLTIRESCGCTPEYLGHDAEEGRRAMARQFIHETELARAMSSFSGRLLGTSHVDMHELGRILVETLPSVGISRSLLGVYEVGADDPSETTVIQRTPDEPPLRFPSRTFPPAELVPRDEAFLLIVIPLQLHDELGFMALSAENLGFCVAVAAQSEAAFESARNLRVRREAEAALAASEEQLRQAQKMEAVGRLAGGVAHDFNNLLTAISGYTEIVLADLGREGTDRDEIRERVERIGSAADRAAALTRQLLAFSRRQIMQPVVVDVNDVVGGAQALLEPLLGEDVELVLALGEDAGRARVDRNQLEQVILNLAVNAREAMRSGGTVALATASRRVDGDGPHALPPGDYVTLTVTDTGAGMDADTAARVFEPFFTTKEHGTGLGLATAYGIVKQFGGEIAVESAPGAGSAFTLFLPLVDAEPEREPGRARRVEGLRGATILLVEDEEGVRSFVTEILRRQGLDILVAADADEALVLSRGHSGGIDILVTDIVLPAMNGRDLAQHLAGERPELRVLYISGYAQEAIFDEYVIPATTAFLAKPFSGGALLDALAGLIIDEAAATA